jgi:prevent-host-death family protein
MKTIAQRELRNRSGEILRQAETGQQFAVTVDGRPVAVLGPYPKRQWVPKAELLQILRSQAADPALLQEIAEMGGALEDLESSSRS